MSEPIIFCNLEICSLCESAGLTTIVRNPVHGRLMIVCNDCYRELLDGDDHDQTP